MTSGKAVMDAQSVLRNLKTDDLRYLLAVANTGRIGAAADHLSVDASTVSRRLRALEKVLGTRVITRSSDGWELTEFGGSIVERARPIEEALESVARAVGGESGDSVRGDFRLTAPDGFATVFAVPALQKLRTQHPGLNVELLTATRQLNLHQAGFDLAVAVGTPITKRLFTEALTQYRLSFYATDEYLERNGTPATLDELSGHTIAFYVESLLQVGDLDFSHYAPGVDVRFASTNIFAQLEAAVSSAAIALIPRFMALRSPDLRELDHLRPSTPLRYVLATRRESLARPAVKAVRDALAREVAVRRHELL
ncbi:LysR family transcriptional regulator [Gordonia humi]|uniref:DNA-binding transcriptional LysR family regulator n=1 Tax=Gordonia humi TaxID=686429 RepID=A0A840F240_9ACTN|nr:LysR family transcriptional regulator [Gordonia humi]MBB4137962.1 DNA-binding transcriptional LysR family regulator [Gordonia humi]